MALPQERKSTVEGIVLDVQTNKPIQDAIVILAAIGETRRERDSYSVVTDKQGRFVFKDVGAGSYRMAFARNGYVRQEYGQRRFPGSGTPLEITEGKDLRNLVVRLTPAGTISGRIRDENDEPLAGIPIRLLRSIYNSNGEREMVVYGTAETDDRGEYRMYFITPGRYYLHAGTPQGPGWSARIRPTLNAIPGAYPSSYFPGVAALHLATVLEIKPGGELAGVDWTLRQQRLHSVRGRVMDATTGQSPPKAELRLTYEDLSGDGANKGSYENGVFEFRNIVPGLYGLTATDATGREVYSRGSMPVEVKDSDIDGLVLHVSTGASITGRVRLDRSNSPMPASGPFIELSPVVDGSTQQRPGQFSFYAYLQPDGTFFIPNVTPGEYDVRFWLQPSFYIQKALYGGTDVLTRPLHFTGEKSRTLEIVLASDVGSLSGSVTSPLGSVPGAQVLLVPNGMRHRVELFRTVMTNQEGRFTIANIVPGHYKVFAWEVIEENSWFDPAVLARSESLATSIHIAESSAQTIQLRTLNE